ncbi:MAG: hypothetical protein ACOYWZ_23870 [Bacillota bacterium]
MDKHTKTPEKQIPMSLKMGNVSIEKLIEVELKGIPKDKLKEIYVLIHYFRIGIGRKDIAEDIKSLRLASEKKFAEIWRKEKDDVWESYL